jgi:PAS domain S-box-containing protein
METVNNSKRILHIDDEPGFADMAADFLEREVTAFEVETAENARRGLEMLSESDYQCVISDYDMPGLNGIDFLEEVRETHPDLPFILYTGKGSEQVASDAISAGATDYLQKESGTGQYELLANRIQNAIAQARSQRAERHLRELAENTEQVLSIFNHDWTELEFINSAYEDIWGRSVETLRDDPTDFLDGIHPEDRDRVQEAMERLFEGETVKLEYRINATEDSQRWVAVRGEPITDETGDVIRVAGLATDVTARKRQEQQLETQRDLLRHGERLSDIGGWEVDLITDEVRWSDGTYAIHELSPDSFDPTFEDGIDFYHPEDRGAIKEAVSHCRETGEPYEIECRLITAEDRIRWVKTNGEAVTQNGRIVALRGAIQDVTERKRQQQELRRVNQEYEIIFEEVDDSLFLTDVKYTESEPEFLVRRVNPANAELIGKPVADVDGETLLDLFGPDIGSEIKANYERCLRASETIKYEEVIEHQGDRRIFETTLSPVHSGGQISAIVGVAHEITDRKRRQREFERYQTIIDALGDPVYTLDSNGCYTYVNEAFVEETGYTREDIIGEHVSTVVPDEYVERGEAIIRELLQADDRRKATWELEGITAEGKRVPAENHVALLPFTEGEYSGSAGILRRIGDRKERERQLTQLHERTRDLLEPSTKEATSEIAVEAALEIIDAQLNGIHLLNERGDRLVGIEATEEFYELFDELPDYERNNATGTTDALIWDVFESGEPMYIQDTHEFERIDVDPLTRSAMVFPIGDYGVFIASSEEPDHFDDTDWILMETLSTLLSAALDRVEREQELQQERDRLDEFASVISHDLRNPLNVAEARVELARQECESEHLADAASAVDRSLSLIDDLLMLSRQGGSISEFETVELPGVINESWRNVKTNEASLSIETDHAIRASPSRLKQLLENLIRNAVEHAGDEVYVTIGDLDGGFYVADNGPGIPEDEREQVFEAGYSSIAGGTGFGLNIVYEIALAHDWQISVTESKDGGAQFDITGVEAASRG